MKNQTLLDAQKLERKEARARFETSTLTDALSTVQFTDKEDMFHRTKGWDTTAILNAYMSLVMDDLHQVESLTGKLNESLDYCEGRNVSALGWQLFGVSSHLRGSALNLQKAIRRCLDWEPHHKMSQAIALSAHAYLVAHVASDLDLKAAACYESSTLARNS